MKNEKKPMRNKRFLLHILQQIAAFGMVSGVAFLVLFSFVMDDSVTRRFDIFSEEKHFEDTDVFDEMLVNSLYSIIRYNVAKARWRRADALTAPRRLTLWHLPTVKRGNAGQRHPL